MPSRTTLTMGSAEASIGFTIAIEFLMSVIICSGMCSYNVSHASEFDTDGGIELIDKPPVVCQGHYEYHLQGITGNRKDMLYWSYTTVSGTVPREPGNLASSHDRSVDDAFPPIGRQYESSCSGWGTAYYSTTYIIAKLRNWNAKTGGDQYRCSRYWTLNLVKDGRRGEKDIAYWHSGVQVKHGCAMLSDFPQGEPNFQKSWCTDPAVWRKAISYRMKSRKILKNINTPSGLRALKEHILDDRYGIATAGDSPSRGAWVTTII
ncbi:hypothetical protein KA005_17545, partial [bacterium]|nr:hypothetical protein [bacterium]